MRPIFICHLDASLPPSPVRPICMRPICRHTHVLNGVWQAAAAADVADVAVLVLGLSTCQYPAGPLPGGGACLEAEGRDRRSLQLPPIQARVSAWRVLFRPIQARVKPDIAVASDITSLAVTPR
jgi:hypothetical protein